MPIRRYHPTGCNLTPFNGSNTVKGTQRGQRAEGIDRGLLTMWFQRHLSSLGRWLLAQCWLKRRSNPLSYPYVLLHSAEDNTTWSSCSHCQNLRWTSQPSFNCVVFCVDCAAVAHQQVKKVTLNFRTFKRWKMGPLWCIYQTWWRWNCVFSLKGLHFFSLTRIKRKNHIKKLPK